MIVERVADTHIMATIIVIIISGNGFIEFTQGQLEIGGLTRGIHT
jgi:hypothetical protein